MSKLLKPKQVTTELVGTRVAVTDGTIRHVGTIATGRLAGWGDRHAARSFCLVNDDHHVIPFLKGDRIEVIE